MLYLRLILTFRQINISNRIPSIPVNGFYFWPCIGLKSQAYIGISPILSHKRELIQVLISSELSPDTLASTNCVYTSEYVHYNQTIRPKFSLE